MRVTATAPVLHLCPHVDEVDAGSLVMTWDGAAVELHALAAQVAGYRRQRITHEALVDDLASYIEQAGGRDVEVTGWFTTAGLEVEVRS